MKNKTKLFIFMVLMIFLVWGLALGLIAGFSYLDYRTKTSACNEIGFSNYELIGNEEYCTNDSVNLYRVNMETEKNGFTYKATKINLYNYGKE